MLKLCSSIKSSFYLFADSETIPEISEDLKIKESTHDYVFKEYVKGN